MPNINIDDAYILNETGAQVDKVTGLFTKDEDTTSGEKAFAQLNIGTAGSNRNLLDNPWFGSEEIVNQRQVTTGALTHLKYIIDRWMTSYDGGGGQNGTYSLGTSGITLIPASRTKGGIAQRLSHPMEIGKTYTASVLYSDGTIDQGTAVARASQFNFFNFGSGGSRFQWAPTYNWVWVTCGSEKTIRAVKLELGSVSTLANDAPPDYGTELIKCRGYFERIHTLGSSEVVGMGFGASSSSVRIGVPSLICHNIGTVTYSGAGLLLEGNGGYLTISSINKLNNTPKNGFLTLTIGASGTVTPYQAYALVGTAEGGYIDISADL